MRYSELVRTLQKSNCNLFIVLFSYIKYRLKGKHILKHQKVKIKGLSNIYTFGLLRIGINYVAFDDKRDFTLINVTGKLTLNGNISIGRGSRISIDGDATIAENTYINSNCLFVIQHKLSIGKNCAISWNCQFLDDDFHYVHYADKKESINNEIAIGDHVLIGNNSFIYKGVKIPNGCVVAANAVVRDKFEEENALIAGNPAKVVKRNITWK